MFSHSSVLRMRVEDNKGINKGRKIKWRKNFYISSKTDEFTTRRLKKKKKKKKGQWLGLADIPKWGGKKHKLKLSVMGSLHIRVTEKQWPSSYGDGLAHTSGGDCSCMSSISGPEGVPTARWTWGDSPSVQHSSRKLLGLMCLPLNFLRPFLGPKGRYVSPKIFKTGVWVISAAGTFSGAWHFWKASAEEVQEQRYTSALRDGHKMQLRYPKASA